MEKIQKCVQDKQARNHSHTQVTAGPLRGGPTADVARVSFSEESQASFAVDESTKKKRVQFVESVNVRRFKSDSTCVVDTVDTLCVYDLRRLGIAIYNRLTDRNCHVTYDTFEMIGYILSILEKFDDGADVVAFNAGGKLSRPYESKLREFLDLLVQRVMDEEERFVAQQEGVTEE